MTTKSNVSSDYLKQQHILHRDKKWNNNDLRVIITGANKEDSIGREIGDVLSRFEFCTLIRGYGGNVTNAIDPAMHPFTNFNTLVCSHGVTWLDWFEDIPTHRLREIIDVNLTGTALIAQKFVTDTLTTKERKRIIFIGSMAHRAVLNASAVYCASKAGLAMLGRCLAWELAPKGYDVFTIHPSNTEGTPMSEETIKGLERYRGISYDCAKEYWNDSPLRSHMLQTDDIAALVMFLLGPHADYLSGCQLELSGGQR